VTRAVTKRTTKERIVDAAIDLFNAKGVTAITTNHVAEHLGMSPGNLYYHFANKEEIVLAAFERMSEEADAIWQEPDPKAPFDPRLMQRIVAGNLDLFGRYVFFARELPALLRADDELRARYVAVAETRMKQLETMIRALASAKILSGLDDDEDLRALAESAWMIGLFCVPYAETMEAGPPAKTAKARLERTRAAVEKGALLVLHLFERHMDPMAYAAMVVLVRTELEGAAKKNV